MRNVSYVLFSFLSLVLFPTTAASKDIALRCTGEKETVIAKGIAGNRTIGISIVHSGLPEDEFLKKGGLEILNESVEYFVVLGESEASLKMRDGRAHTFREYSSSGVRSDPGIYMYERYRVSDTAIVLQSDLRLSHDPKYSMKLGSTLDFTIDRTSGDFTFWEGSMRVANDRYQNESGLIKVDISAAGRCERFNRAF